MVLVVRLHLCLMRALSLAACLRYGNAMNCKRTVRVYRSVRQAFRC